MLRAIIATTLVVLVSPLTGNAEDCEPTRPTLESFGLDDINMWIFPVRNTGPGFTVAGEGTPFATLRYSLQVLDQRLCPLNSLSVLTTGTGWDAPPVWTTGSDFWFFVTPERREAIVNDLGGVEASADSCRGYVDRIELGENYFSVTGNTIAFDTVMLRPATESDRLHPEGTSLYAERSSPPIFVPVPADQADTIVTWASVLAGRPVQAVVGLSYANQEAACGGRTGDGTQCSADTDCAICHDGSACGTVMTRQEMLSRGEACEMEDSAECEYARVRCCGGICRLRPH